jgi:hypothetical protein
MTDDTGPIFIFEVTIAEANCSRYFKQLFEFCLDVRIIFLMLKVYIADTLVKKVKLLKQKEKESDSNSRIHIVRSKLRLRYFVSLTSPQHLINSFSIHFIPSPFLHFLFVFLYYFILITIGFVDGFIYSWNPCLSCFRQIGS